jgi:DNA replication protein DnaC
MYLGPIATDCSFLRTNSSSTNDVVNQPHEEIDHDSELSSRRNKPKTLFLGDDRYPKLLATLAKTEVLILDDWGLAKLTAENRRDLLEILEDRHGARSTLATSQLPIEKSHDIIGDPALADTILDRLVYNAYKINLKGGSMRKRKAKLTRTTQAG